MKKLFAIVAFMLPVALMAQEEKPEAASVPASETAVQVAAELSKYGYAHGDALSLIQAARMAKQAGMTQEAREKAETQGGQADQGAKSGKVCLDPAQLLADAKELAKNDGVLNALIDQVKNNVRGAVGGPKYAVSSVNAHGTHVYRVNFRAGETGIVTVVGDGDTDLDLYVYDQNGNLIDKDVDYTDNCVCTFVPRWTGLFVIKIVNRGSVYNRYVLRTN